MATNKEMIVMHQSNETLTSDKTQSTTEELFNNGYMCSESIVAACSSLYGPQAETAIRMSAGFAGGMVHGKTCGAISGVIMVISLKLGPGINRDQYSKELCIQAIQELFHRFKQRRKTVECRELLLINNVNYDNPDEMRNLRNKGICESIVRDVAELLEEILAEFNPKIELDKDITHTGN